MSSASSRRRPRQRLSGGSLDKVGRIPTTLVSLGESIFNPGRWLLIGVVVVAILVIAFRALPRRPEPWLVAGTVGLILGGLILVYMATPLELHAHLFHSARRVVSGPVLFAAVLAPLLLEAVLGAPQREDARQAVPSASVTAVLFTCAGQRVDIVTAFRRAGATTIASDLDRLAPALYHADHMALVPRVDDPGYLPALAALVAEYDVKLVVPVTDIDQSIVARGRDAARAGAAARAAVRGVRDDGGQVRRARLLRGARDPEPAHVAPGRGARRRPLSRCSSRSARASARATSTAPPTPTELEFFLGHTPVESMVQELCVGEEFSIDVFCDLEGRCLNAIARTMIQSKGGESIKGTSILDRDLIEHARHVAETIGIVGPACIQCFREPDGSLPVTDVNPRFGGAFPLPLAAGSRYPELALALANGERPEPRSASIAPACR